MITDKILLETVGETFMKKLWNKRDEHCFIITLNKQQAKYLLSTDVDNRNVENSLIDKYTNKMNLGLWTPKKEDSILLSYYYDGKLIDGQHRLFAFLKSKLKTFTTYICFG